MEEIKAAYRKTNKKNRTVVLRDAKHKAVELAQKIKYAAWELDEVMAELEFYAKFMTALVEVENE